MDFEQARGGGGGVRGGGGVHVGEEAHSSNGQPNEELWLDVIFTGDFSYTQLYFLKKHGRQDCGGKSRDMLLADHPIYVWRGT